MYGTRNRRVYYQKTMGTILYMFIISAPPPSILIIRAGLPINTFLISPTSDNIFHGRYKDCHHVCQFLSQSLITDHRGHVFLQISSPWLYPVVFKPLYDPGLLSNPPLPHKCRPFYIDPNGPIGHTPLASSWCQPRSHSCTVWQHNSCFHCTNSSALISRCLYIQCGQCRVADPAVYRPCIYYTKGAEPFCVLKLAITFPGTVIEGQMITCRISSP